MLAFERPPDTHVGDSGNVNHPDSEHQEQQKGLEQGLDVARTSPEFDASFGCAHLIDMVDDLCSKENTVVKFRGVMTNVDAIASCNLTCVWPATGGVRTGGGTVSAIVVSFALDGEEFRLSPPSDICVDKI